MVLKKLLAIVIVTVMTATVFSVCALTGRAEMGPVDFYGYTWTDSNAPDPMVSFDWIEVSGTGTDTGVYGDDNYGGPFPIGFDFDFYGNTYGMFNVSTNGFIMFDGSGYYLSNYEIPDSFDPNNLVAVYWDDLEVDDFDNSAAIYYATIGLAPERQMVIEFLNICELGSSDLMTFEIILNETGEIWFQYGPMSGNTGHYAAVGIENDDGTSGCEYSYYSDSLNDDLAVMFSLSGVAIGPAQESETTPGDYAEYLLTVENNGPVTDSFDITYLSSEDWVVERFDAILDPLGDDNMNGIPDTGDISPGSSADIVIRVTAPVTPSTFEDVTMVYATSYNTPSSIASASLTTTVIGAVFSPPHHDFVEDTDSDGLYNTLSINVSLEVYFADSYGIYALLSILPYSEVARAEGYAAMDVGPQTLNLTFDARIINSYGIDGPYTIDLHMYSYDIGNQSSTSSHLTAAYSWTDFDPPEVSFNTPFADYGYDSDGDTLYNELVIEATVDVTVGGDYLMWTTLWDVYGDYVDGVSDYYTLAVGTQVVEFRFSGPAIWYGYHDGPFESYLHVWDESMVELDVFYYTTASYTYDEFQPLASLAPPFSDFGWDNDANGLFDYLIVQVAVDVYLSGYCFFDADLYDSGMSFVVTYSTYVWLDVGEGVIEFWFDGDIIRDNGVNGSYTVDFYFADDTYRYIDGDSYETDTYSYDEFEGGARILSPHSEYTVDADSDSLFDSLVLVLDVEIFGAGYYFTAIELYDEFGYYVGYTTRLDYFEVGISTMEIEFAGWLLQTRGFDGPYHASAYLYDGFTSVLYDEYDFVTADYTYDQFEPPSEITPPHSEHVYDVGDDGFYDYLVIEVSVDITCPGEYILRGWLFEEGGSYICDSENATFLDAGVQTIDLYFSGRSIFDSGIDGPYTMEVDLQDADWGTTDYDIYTTGSYTYDEFQPPSSSFSTSFWDFGVDASGDGLYEYLVVVITVEVLVAGQYTVIAELYGPYGSYFIAWVMNTSYLEVGLQEVELWFDGPTIRSSGMSGHYDLFVHLNDVDWATLDYFECSTSLYDWSDFQALAWFTPPHSDHGYDPDGDLIYEHLVIDVTVEVFISSELTVRAYVFDEYVNFIADVETTQYCEPGFSVISIYIPGWDILENGIDGPYYVDLYLSDDHSGFVDSDYYITSSYAFNEFSQIPAQFAPPHSDHGYDDDDDMLYEHLVVDARVNVTLEGTYCVEASLSTAYSGIIDSVVVEVTLSEGLQVIEIMFDGWIIAANGFDGSYEVTMYLYMDDGTYLVYDIYDTDPYLASEFDPTVPKIYSYWTPDAPFIDGVYSSGEWEDAACVSLSFEDLDNALDAVMLILNNGTHLFVCLDVIGDITEDSDDIAAICFDTGNDAVLTTGHEDEFALNDDGWLTHQVYDSNGSWEVHCSPFDPLLPYHENLAAMSGFGASDNAASDHRVFEFCIPLDLIGAVAGDTLGFASGVVDSSDGTIDYWPLFDHELFGNIALFGDLVLYSSAPPATTIDITGTAGSNGWYTSEVEFTLTSEDAEEGVDHISYRLDGGEWTDYAGSVTVSVEGPHTLEFYSIDLAGNQELVQEVSINIDMTAPEATSVPSGTLGENGWYTSTVMLYIQCSDGHLGSGIASVTIRIDGGSWINYTSPVIMSGDGVFLVEYYCTDLVGISSDIQELTVKVDSTAPVTTASVDGSTVTLSATDPASGVYLTKYRIDGGDWTNYTSPFEVSGTGNHSVEFYSIDNAGNAGDISLQFLDNGSGGSTVFGVDLWTLIMVLLILAIIIGISIPFIYGMRRKAKDAETKAIMKDSVSPVAQLYDDNPQPFPPKAPEPELPADEEKPPKKD